MNRVPAGRVALALALGVALAVILVMAITGAHKGSSRPPHHPWASAGIAAVILLVATGVGVLVAARRRR